LGYYPPYKATDLLGVQFLFSTTDLPGISPLRREGVLRIYGNPGVLPLAWVVDRVMIGHGEQGALDALADKSLDPRDTAVLREDDAGRIGVLGEGEPGSAEVVEYAPGRVRIRASTDHAALLVTSEQDYPGWLTRVDGVPAEAVNVNYAFRGVPLQAGEHEVEFRYRPRSVAVGGALTLAGLLISLAAVFYRRLGIRRLLRRRLAVSAASE
jgi:hypothetical protein